MKKKKKRKKRQGSYWFLNGYSRQKRGQTEIQQSTYFARRSQNRVTSGGVRESGSAELGVVIGINKWVGKGAPQTMRGDGLGR